MTGQEIYLRIRVPARVLGLSREDWLGELWVVHALQPLILGIFEGEVLSSEAQYRQLASAESILDSGIAPQGRDWISESNSCECHIYTATIEDAERVARYLREEVPEVDCLETVAREASDWNAEWKKHFTGVDVSPYFRIEAVFEEGLPPEETATQSGAGTSGVRTLWIRPGSGFGTGTHETTRICLWSLGLLAESGRLAGARVLDFGSGSGILSIGAALLGAQEAWGVEVDPLANQNAEQNKELNLTGLQRCRVEFLETLDALPVGIQFDGVVANILRPVLVEFAKSLTSRLKPGGWIVLSGLLQPDLERVKAAHAPAVLNWKEIQCGEWWGLVGQCWAREGEEEWLSDLPTSRFKT